MQKPGQGAPDLVADGAVRSTSKCDQAWVTGWRVRALLPPMAGLFVIVAGIRDLRSRWTLLL